MPAGAFEAEPPMKPSLRPVARHGTHLKTLGRQQSMLQLERDRLEDEEAGIQETNITAIVQQDDEVHIPEETKAMVRRRLLTDSTMDDMDADHLRHAAAIIKHVLEEQMDQMRALREKSVYRHDTQGKRLDMYDALEGSQLEGESKGSEMPWTPRIKPMPTLASTAEEEAKAKQQVYRKKTMSKAVLRSMFANDGMSLYDSGNTLSWLTRMEQKMESNFDDEIIHPSWAFVFPLYVDTQSSNPVPRDRRIPHECWFMCERAWACGMKITHEIMSNGELVCVLMGAPLGILEKEAVQSRVMMRMQCTKGSIPYHTGLQHHLATRHGGLNEWTQIGDGTQFPGGDWERRQTHRHEHAVRPKHMPEQKKKRGMLGKTVGLMSGLKGLAGKQQTRAAAIEASDVHAIMASEQGSQSPRSRMRSPGSPQAHQKPLGDLGEQHADDVDVEHRQQLFTSTSRQRLVAHRVLRLAHINFELDAKKKSGDEDRMLTKMVSRVARGECISGPVVLALMNVLGAYRPHAIAVFPTDGKGDDGNEISPIVHVANTVSADPFIVFTKGMEDLPHGGVTTGMERNGIPAVRYEDLERALELLSEWRHVETGPGRAENFCGTLVDFYPLHDMDELQFLQTQWGSFDILTRGKVNLYNGEIADSPAFSSSYYRLTEHNLPWSWTCQPMYEVREYFGEELALYFTWLGLYTKSLIVLSLFGCVCMICQPIFGGVDKNPLTLAYSIYVAIWSITFLEAYKRRERELAFLWEARFSAEGSDLTPVRAEFKGAPSINEETGKSTQVHISVRNYLAKRVLCWTVTITLMLATVAAAYLALQIRMVFAVENPKNLWERYKPDIISASLNLGIIQTFGVAYEQLAVQMNIFENHRTEADFNDALVTKFFSFQFVNNYFLLFYIAYLKEFRDPIWGHSSTCPDTCLPDLQFQMLVVFTGKSVGKQLFYTLRPFLMRHLNEFLNMRKLKMMHHKAMALPNNAACSIDPLLPLGAHNVLWQMEEAEVHNQKRLETAENLKDAILAEVPKINHKNLRENMSQAERELHMMPQESTLYDFNDRCIQFGYLVLFGSTFPLAPFIAYLNNVIEIRAGSMRVCSGYRRAIWRQRYSIGAWLPVLTIIAALGVITNCTMIAFVGQQMAKDLNLDEKHYESFTTRVNSISLCWAFFAIEHVVTFVRVVVMAIYPTNPHWITMAAEVLAWRSKNVYITRHEQELITANEAKLQDTQETVTKRQLRYAKLDRRACYSLFCSLSDTPAGGASSDTSRLGATVDHNLQHALSMSLAGAGSGSKGRMFESSDQFSGTEPEPGELAAAAEEGAAKGEEDGGGNEDGHSISIKHLRAMLHYMALSLSPAEFAEVVIQLDGQDGAEEGTFTFASFWKMWRRYYCRNLSTVNCHVLVVGIPSRFNRPLWLRRFFEKMYGPVMAVYSRRTEALRAEETYRHEQRFSGKKAEELREEANTLHAHGLISSIGEKWAVIRFEDRHHAQAAMRAKSISLTERWEQTVTSAAEDTEGSDDGNALVNVNVLEQVDTEYTMYLTRAELSRNIYGIDPDEVVQRMDESSCTTLHAASAVLQSHIRIRKKLTKARTHIGERNRDAVSTPHQSWRNTTPIEMDVSGPEPAALTAPEAKWTELRGDTSAPGKNSPGKRGGMGKKEKTKKEKKKDKAAALVSPGAGPFLGRQPAKGPGLRKSLAVKVPGAIADEDS